MDVTPMEFLAHTYGGFTAPWRSAVEGWSGEDAYTTLVAEHVSDSSVLVEAGCGHGAEALTLASRAQRVIAFDVIDDFIQIARRDTAERGVKNVEFLAWDCSPKRNRGARLLPVDDGAADLIVSRRGPTSWISDARRALGPGGVMIHLAFMQPPEPAWNRDLPESLRLVTSSETMPTAVHDRLASAGIDLHSAWCFDVPERFNDPFELYKRLAWERRAPVPPFTEVSEQFATLFERHDGAGVSIRQRRFLWKAIT